MLRTIRISALPLAFALAACFCTADPAPFPSSGVAHLLLDGNRIYAELAFVRPDGTLRTALAFVDMGSPSMIVSEALFRDLQLDQKKSLNFRIGDFPVVVDSRTVTKDSSLPFSISKNRPVEALLPAGVMRNYQVALDYPGRSLTFAIPGTPKAGGIPIPFRMNEKSGLIAIAVSIDGRAYPITVDCGSAYTWIAKSVARPWLAAHPAWERGAGAVGPSNMRMADDGIEAAGTLLRIPEILAGTLQLHEVGALAIGPSNSHWDFIAWYSAKNPEPVIGWLGGNVLQNFRIVLDYPKRMSYWLKEQDPDVQDLYQVGLTLEFTGGLYRVAAIATRHGQLTVAGVEVGDLVFQVDALRTANAARGEIFSALHGAPGDSRTLVLDRNGKRFTVQAAVTPF